MGGKLRKTVRLIDILEMGPAQLRLCRTIGQSPFVNCYREILLNDDQAKTSSLETILKDLKIRSAKNISVVEKRFLKTCLALKLQIHRGVVQISEVEDAALFFENMPLDLKAEGFFIVATAFELNQQDDEATAYYRYSHDIFSILESPRKAVKALYNAIAAESRLPANQNYSFMADYLQVYNLSTACGETKTARRALQARQHVVNAISKTQSKTKLLQADSLHPQNKARF